MAEISQKKRIWGWFFFDWASQPYNTLMLTFIFGPYFGQTAAAALMANGMSEQAAEAEAQALWGYGLALTHWWVDPMGPAGFWIGLVAGLTSAAVFLGWRLRWRLAQPLPAPPTSSQEDLAA